MAVNRGESPVPNPRAVAAAEADVTPVPPFAIGTVPVRISAPSIVTTPALERAIVVSDACPNSILPLVSKEVPLFVNVILFELVAPKSVTS